MGIVNNNISIEDARIGFRNFAGKEGKFNPAGRRNFCVFLDYEVGKALEKDGWNIRWLEPRDDRDEKQPYLQVAVRFDNIPPKIVIVSSKGMTILDQDTVALLDWAEIKTVDMTIRPYNWEANGKVGVKAYVKTMYVTIEEDEFAAKYYDTPDAVVDLIGGCGNCDECDGSCHSRDKLI